MLRHLPPRPELGAWPGPVKKLARKVKKGVKRGAKTVARGVKKGGKLTFRQFLKVSKLALKGMCALPGPARQAAIAAALTAATGGAGVAASSVSNEAANAVCKAMKPGAKAADVAQAQRAVSESTGVPFAEDSWWDQLMRWLGLGG